MKKIKALLLTLILAGATQVQAVEYDPTQLYYNNGNFGIGTTNPQMKLSVYGNGIQIMNLEGDRIGRLAFNEHDAATPLYCGILYDRLYNTLNERGASLTYTYTSMHPTSGGIRFYSRNDTPSLYKQEMVLVNGRLGIGIANPSTTLHVSGNAIITQGLISNGAIQATRFIGDGSGLTDLPLSSAGNLTIPGGPGLSKITLGEGLAPLDYGAFVINANQQANGYSLFDLLVNSKQSGSLNTAGVLSVKHDGAPGTDKSYFSIGLNNGAGQVSDALVVNSAGTVTAKKFVGDGSGLTGISAGGSSPWTAIENNMIIYSGLVGIGVTRPRARLDIEGEAMMRGIQLRSNAHMLYPYAAQNITITPESTATKVGENLGTGIYMASRFWDGSNSQQEGLTIQNRRSGDSTNAFNIEFVRGSSNGNISLMRIEANTQNLDLTGKLVFGNSGYYPTLSNLDTNLYRSAANTLKTDGDFIVAKDLTVSGKINATRFVGDGSGLTNLPTSGGTSQWETGSESSISYMAGKVLLRERVRSGPEYLMSVGAPGLWVNAQSGSNGITAYRADNLYFNVNMDNTNVYLSSAESQPMVFKQGTTERMKIAANGNIGIGTSTPIVKLQVNGEVRFGDPTQPQQSLTMYGQNSGKNLPASGHEASGIQIINLANTDNNFSQIKFFNSNSLADSGIWGVHKSHTSRLGELVFMTHNGTSMEERMRITSNGNIGIGTSTPTEKLTIKGGLIASRINVKAPENIPDYVFEEDYNLRSLQEVEAYYKANKHLPGILSEEEIKKSGKVDMSEMQMKLLEKIEELTIYVVEQQKEIDALKKRSH